MGNGIPGCVGIIMDGNRRWAKEHGMPTLEGHRKGLATTKKIVRHAFDRGVNTIFLYAFSTENWNREPEEVSYLMSLFAGALVNELKELMDEGVRVRFIGQRERLASSLQSLMVDTEKSSEQGTKGTLVIAISYGGRSEILSAVNKLLEEGRETVTEPELRDAMWTAGTPDPDLIIRTGKEKRLSNFLPWQSAYSEFYFSDTYWPDFSQEELDTIFADFASRERRRGK